MREVISGLFGTIASLLAASCCIGPTLFVVFGVSAGGLGYLTVLEPYRPFFLLIGYIAVAYSFYKIYLKNRIKKSGPECACEEPYWIRKLSKGVTWTALFLLIFATIYPYILIKIYGG